MAHLFMISHDSDTKYYLTYEDNIHFLSFFIIFRCINVKRYYYCRELKRATAYKGDKCSIFSGEKKLFGTNEIAVKQDQ